MRHSVGTALRVTGILVNLYALLHYGWGIAQLWNDPSVHGYAGLVAVIGLLYLVGGTGLIWLGSRLRRPAASADDQGDLAP